MRHCTLGRRLATLARAAAAVALAAAWPLASAQAQSSQAQSSTAAEPVGPRFPGEGQPVAERPRPDFDARGLPLGAFRLYPALEVGALYDDNVFAAETPQEEDVFFTARPELRLASQWPVHALELAVEGFARRANEQDDQDLARVTARAQGRLDIRRNAWLAAQAAYTDGEESLADSPFAAAAAPAPFRSARGRLEAAAETARLRVRGGVGAETFDYDDTVAASGLPLDQDDRDRTVSVADLRGDLMLGAVFGVFAEAGANRREFDRGPPVVPASRDSEGYLVSLGTVWEFTRLLRGEIGARYLSQEFDDPAAKPIDDVGALAALTWLPTELTTVRVRVAREVGDSGVGPGATFLAKRYAATVDHELRRNVLLEASAAYVDEDYRGLDREDERTEAALGARWLLNRTASVSARVETIAQDSAGAAAGRAFDRNAVSLGLRLQL